MAKHKHQKRFSYSLMDELMASATQPMPDGTRAGHLARMRGGLVNIMHQARPSHDDWGVLADCINFMETLRRHGPWRMLDGSLAEVQDASGLLDDALGAMAIAGARHMEEGKPIRLDGPGLEAIRGLLDDYAEILGALPHRTMVQVHRKTERRLRAVLERKHSPNELVITT